MKNETNNNILLSCCLVIHLIYLYCWCRVARVTHMRVHIKFNADIHVRTKPNRYIGRHTNKQTSKHRKRVKWADSWSREKDTRLHSYASQCKTKIVSRKVFVCVRARVSVYMSYIHLYCHRCRCRCFGVVISRTNDGGGNDSSDIYVCVCLCCVCVCVCVWVREKQNHKTVSVGGAYHQAYDRISKVCIFARFSLLLVYIVVDATPPLYPHCAYKHRYSVALVFVSRVFDINFFVVVLLFFSLVFDRTFNSYCRCVCTDAFVVVFLSVLNWIR